MPAIVFPGLVFAMMLSLAVFVLMFISVAFAKPEALQTEMTAQQAQALFTRISNQRIDPADGHSPTFGELVQRGHLEEFLKCSSRSLVQ
jgi:hypothetical protein